MPENPVQTLAAWLAAKQQLAEKLQGANIPEEEYYGLYALLDTVTGTDPEAIRATQFEADARDLLIECKAATERNVTRVSAFLRQFAEHIVRQMAPDGTNNEVIAARVDGMHSLIGWLERPEK